MPGALFEATGFQKGADFENKRMYNIEGAVLLVLIPSERYPFCVLPKFKKGAASGKQRANSLPPKNGLELTETVERTMR